MKESEFCWENSCRCNQRWFESFISCVNVIIYKCAARDSRDNYWYRYRVIGTCQNKIDVITIDYGTRATMDIDCLRHLHVKFSRLPRQAFLGKIFGILPIADIWSKQSALLLYESVKGGFFNYLNIRNCY